MNQEVGNLNSSSSMAGALSGVAILLVEDDSSASKVYTKWLQEAGAVVTHFFTVAEFKKALGEFCHSCPHPKIALTDLVLPDGSGLEVVDSWKKHFPQYPVLVATAFATVENAVQAMKLGAFDFVRKPVLQQDLILILRRANDYLMLLQENETLSSSVRILGMAQTLSQITDSASLLKTTGRLISRETRVEECFVFLFEAKKTRPDCLLECRSPGLPRMAPEIITSTILSDICASRLATTKEQANGEDNSTILPTIVLRLEHSAMIIDFTSQTHNQALIVLIDRSRIAEIHAQIADLQPLLLQASRSFQNSDITTTLSFVDGLTGLYNQKFLAFSLKSEIARANRYGNPVSVLFIDLDHFKEVNDNHGHVVGSQLLKDAAEIFRNNVRESDFLLRFGGDEFVAILPNTTLEGAHILAERIRFSFDNNLFDARKTTGVASAMNLRVTTSIGVAEYPLCAISYDDLIRKADSAMYEAKREGKNKVCTVDALSSGTTI